ncbi:MAG: PEP-CTERM sorting domain-containing protein [Kiritimatiellales bacterium]
MRILVVSILVCLAATTGFSTLVNQIGTYTNWTTSWTALPGLNDPAGARDEHDFVGDSSNPGAYWADNGTYVFFRFRVDVATVTSTTFRDSHFVMINVAGYNYPASKGSNTNGVLPDYAFAWDSKSNDPLAHGLEMMILSTKDNTWNGVNFDDIDTNAGQKGANDINGSGRTKDGYVRTDDGQATTNFGTTTFVDYAISWSYLTNYTALAEGQTWSIGLASIANATDHNNLTADIGGGADPTSATTVGWSAPVNIPEPATDLLLVLGGGITWLFSRRKRR